MDKVKLLPCARCGNRAFIPLHQHGYQVWCLTDMCLRLPPRATEAEAIEAWNTRPTLGTDELVERLCALHEKMLNAVRRARPYPVSIRMGQSDLDTILGAAVALERAALAAMPAIPPQSLGDVKITREQYAFLMGEGPLEGTWFGELNEGLKGAFWWRALLRCAAGWPTPGPAIDQDGGDQ